MKYALPVKSIPQRLPERLTSTARRGFVTLAGLFFFASAPMTFAQPNPTPDASEQTARPNIVLFVGDDLTWHDSGPYGATDVETPNLDRLASQGMKFNYAFASSPTCSPSRASIYTGLYPFRNGAHANHSVIHDDVRTLPSYMKELGYRVAIAGKTHIGPVSCYPFEYVEGSNVMPPDKEGVLWTDLNTEAVDTFLAEHDHDQPLCLVVCSHSPHVYWPENEHYDPAAIKLPPYLLDTPETREWRAKYYTDVTKMDRKVGEVLASLDKYGYADQTLFMFTADQGAQWPFSKWTLYDAGIRTPLLVRWPEHVEPGSATDALVSLVDLVPTMTEAAGGEAPTDIDGHSLLPVLLGKTDTHYDAIFATHTGDKQMNRTPMRAIRTAQYKYIHNLRPDIRYTTHISDAGDLDGKVYWDSWERLAEHDEHAADTVKRYRVQVPQELYDVQADPYELNNLADDPQFQDVIQDLRKRLEAWRVQQGEDLDVIPMPEDAEGGHMPYAAWE